MRLSKALLVLTLASPSAWAQVNVGEQKPEATLPFAVQLEAKGEPLYTAGVRPARGGDADSTSRSTT